MATFVLPKECWTENYFVPRRTAEADLAAKYPGDETVGGIHRHVWQPPRRRGRPSRNASGIPWRFVKNRLLACGLI